MRRLTLALFLLLIAPFIAVWLFLVELFEARCERERAGYRCKLDGQCCGRRG